MSAGQTNWKGQIQGERRLRTVSESMNHSAKRYWFFCLTRSFSPRSSCLSHGDYHLTKSPLTMFPKIQSQYTLFETLGSCGIHNIRDYCEFANRLSIRSSIQIFSFSQRFLIRFASRVI